MNRSPEQPEYFESSSTKFSHRKRWTWRGAYEGAKTSYAISGILLPPTIYAIGKYYEMQTPPDGDLAYAYWLQNSGKLLTAVGLGGAIVNAIARGIINYPRKKD